MIADVARHDAGDVGEPLSVNRLHHPVTALGSGSRVGIWTQGCAIRCRGCASLDTWAVLVAFLLALLVRTGVFKHIPW